MLHSNIVPPTITKEIVCPHCGNNATLISEISGKKTQIGYPSLNKKYLLKGIFTCGMNFIFEGVPTFEFNRTFLYSNFGFCSACRQTFPIQNPTIRNSASIEIEPKVYRNVTNKKVAGVCAGVADYTGLDIRTVRRSALVSLIFSCGMFGITYLAFWLFLSPNQ